jgi:tRNA threonylcarbamoyladenosine biosynthesis protein TsaE
MERRYSLPEIQDVARALLQAHGDRKVFALHGEMGAGKTTFVHALAEVLGVSSPVSSPTYALIHEYAYGTESMYHMDWYRLQDEEEALQAGIEEVLNSGQRCLVEWPERAAGLLPDDTLHIYLRVEDAQTRLIKTD